MDAFAGYQNEIYMAGLQDALPELPTDLTRLEALAAERLPPTSFAYVAGSAGSESTARANRAAFEAWRLVPRMLRDVTTCDLSVTVLGTTMPAPIALAPVGVLSIVHADGESAAARAAAGVGVPMVVSTAASTTLEDVAEASAMGRAGTSSLAEGPRTRRPARGRSTSPSPGGGRPRLLRREAAEGRRARSVCRGRRRRVDLRPVGRQRARLRPGCDVHLPDGLALPGGGNAVTEHVADQTGWHFVAVESGEGDYDITVEAYRPALETRPPRRRSSWTSTARGSTPASGAGRACGR